MGVKKQNDFLVWMLNLPKSMKLLLVIWFISFCLFVLLVWEEHSGVAVHQSRSSRSRIGYWGNPTANIDWCEDNYAVSPYIAEFWNACSSLSFVATSFVGAYFTLKYRLEQRFLICFASIFIMGWGSISFHATLLRTTQILDEIPMIFNALTFMYIISTMKDHVLSDSQKQRQRFTLGLAYSLFAVGFTVLYFIFPENPAILQATFIGLVLYIIIQTIFMYNQCANFPEAKQLIEWSALSFVFGCFLWVVEPRVCSYIGWMNLHAWWHILVCSGVYLCILFYKYVRLAALGKRPCVVPLSRPTLLPSVLPSAES